MITKAIKFHDTAPGDHSVFSDPSPPREEGQNSTAGDEYKNGSKVNFLLAQR